ncbi:asparagine synthetase [Gregarina niphandrodes]|uniref:asparagine synthase (glutamine-hydrolyzing) n=1 Tax=Gregarina niphandrodes TaxID=110365 RepID=A0A023BBZ6_GRENI|nr:asparagine synthetase [Gregarina niphandrodes]EZG81605.1 asparagine synthetase [Gregarina niphandrodes]|eukprot:XP_011134220.1 asparagine synthetase [Gregarina niphandrodes]
MYKPDLEAALTSWPECRYAVRSQETLDTYSGNGTFFQSEWEMDYLEDSSLLQYSLSWDLASMMSPSVSETGPLAPSFSKISFKVYYAAVGGYAAERGNGTVVGTIRVAEGVSSVAGTCIPMSLQASEVVEQEVDIEVWGYPIVMDWSEDYFVDLDPTYNSTRVDTGPSLASGQVLFDFEFDHPELFTEWEQARRLMTAVAATNPEQAIAGNTPNAQGNYSENILRTSNYGKSSQSATEEWNPASNQAFSICLALKVDLEHIVDNQGVENSIVMNTGLPYRTVAVMESLNHYEVLAGASAEVLPIEDDCPFQCDCRYDLVRNDPWFHGTNEGAVDEAVYAKVCGIFSVFLPSGVTDSLLREKAFQLSRRQRHRGPDSTGVQSGGSYCIVQERLSIIGIATGRQPLLSTDGGTILAANGEVYNYKELAELICTRRGCAYTPRSDSDVIMAMYQEFGRECASLLWGMFGFVIYEKATGQFFAARDGLGVCSLYYGVDQSDGRLYIASEMKCIPCDKVSIFPPGCFLTGTAENYTMVEYYKPAWSNLNAMPADMGELRDRLERSVKYHLAADVPVACFLSGGLNSSIIAAMAQKIMRDVNPEARLKTFSVGMSDSSDLAYARIVAERLGTDHTEVLYTAEEGLDIIPELIWHLETYDPFSIRAAIPMYILARTVRSAGVKVILSGEGADEIFGGYLYFHSAPSAEDFRQETIRRLFDCHLSDGLRANKTSMAQSVELRAPFLGSPFVNYAMTIRAEDRMPKPRGYVPAEDAPTPLSRTSTMDSRTTPDATTAAKALDLPIAEPNLIPTPGPSAGTATATGSTTVSSTATAVSVAGSAPGTPMSAAAAAPSSSGSAFIPMLSGSGSSATAECLCSASTTVTAGDELQTAASMESTSGCAEKWLLRKAFENMLPDEVVWRQKEQFCDGVGAQWLRRLHTYAEERISDAEFAQAATKYAHNTPQNKEEFLYREIFNMEYPGQDRAKTVVMWKPKWVDLDETSGRANPLHWSQSGLGDSLAE